ncbi:MAG: phage adaptor protein, partial [Bacteroidales bacterium]
GNYREPLIEVREGYKYDNFFSGSEEAEYPAYYEKQGDNIILIPTPSENKTLHIQYYKYLPRPSATEAAWDTHTDDLTENGADVIIAMTVQEVAEFLQDYQMASYWANKALYAMRDLVRKDWSRKMPPGFQKEYSDS